MGWEMARAPPEREPKAGECREVRAPSGHCTALIDTLEKEEVLGVSEDVKKERVEFGSISFNVEMRVREKIVRQQLFCGGFVMM